MHVLIVPGWTGSGPEHWQSHWERSNPSYRRVRQRDWDHPTLAEWVACIDAEVEGCGGAVLLVGHSLGCAAIAHWATGGGGGSVVGALLVAPADVEAEGAPEALRGFAPMPRAPLPFASVVVASDDDEYVSRERAREFAEAWGGRFVPIGPAGHINTASGHGPWEEGHRLLRDLMAAASPSAPAMR